MLPSDLAPAALLPGGTGPAPGRDRGADPVRAAADAFEAQFLAQMLMPLFDTLATDGPFGGGFGEAMLRSVLVESFAGSMSAGGGFGISDAVHRELLRIQGDG